MAQARAARGAEVVSGGSEGALTAGEAAGDVAGGAATGAEIGSVVPVFGTAIGAIVGAFKGLGDAIGKGLHDTFHPSAPWAAGWLLVFHVAPGMLYSGVDAIKRDTANAPDDAARLVRMLRLVAGIVPHTGPIRHNPRDVKGPGDKEYDPYLDADRPDPREPFTDRDVTRRILELANAAGGDLTSPTIPSTIKTPAEARAVLRELRGKTFAASGVVSTDMFQAAAPGFREAVKRLRALAGERGPDPVLAHLLGGDVTPASHDPQMKGAPGGAPDSPAGSWSTGEKVAAGVVGAGALAALVAWWRGRREHGKRR